MGGHTTPPPMDRINTGKVLRGGQKHRFGAVLYAQFAFHNRKANWRSFSVPSWYANLFGVHPALLRRKNRELKAHEREKCLLARISWMLEGSKLPDSGGKLSVEFNNPQARPYKNRKAVWAALRTKSRRLMRSNLVNRPTQLITLWHGHYSPAALFSRSGRP